MYREGESKEVRGVKCDLIRVEIGQSYKYLAEGWKMSLNELYPAVKSRDESTPKKRGRKAKSDG